MTRILGAVLAGGRSSRFGSDKAAAMLGVQTLADHAAAVIAPYAQEVVRVGGGGGVADRPGPGLGPLGGIAGALAHARRERFDAVLTIACDMPVVPAGVVAALVRRAPSYCVDAPVLGLWPVAALDALLGLLSSSARGAPSVRHFARTIGAIPVEAPAPIPNVNTREDLLAL